MTQEQKSNDKLATKMIRMDINRVLQRWDPLCLKGLPGADRAYEPFINDLLIMVKKGTEQMAIARHLSDLLTRTWKLPANNKQCVEVAGKLHNIGAMFRGEK
ncbi:hypothetical protein HZA57_08385 [Candidatus Poribacteria bacterium]|nr:hypothetical protein [Candidatus Poribacteria bacterium]